MQERVCIADRLLSQQHRGVIQFFIKCGSCSMARETSAASPGWFPRKTGTAPASFRPAFASSEAGSIFSRCA
jgi:hypothetical protein